MASSVKRIIHDVDFEHILLKIFLYLDGKTIESCSAVSKTWRGFIKDHFQRKSTQDHLKLFWKYEVPTGYRHFIRKDIRGIQADCTSLLLGFADGSAELWDRPEDSKPAERKKCFRVFKDEQPNKSLKFFPVDLSPSFALTGLNLWDKEKEVLLVPSSREFEDQIMKVHLNESKCQILCLTTDGKILEMKIAQDDQTKLWSLTKISTFNVQNGEITCLNIHGDLLLTGDGAGFCRLWKLSCEVFEESHSADKVFKGHEEKILTCFMNSSLAITGSLDMTAKIWNMDNLMLLRTLVHDEKVSSVAFNSCFIFTVDMGSDLYVWDREKCLETQSFPSEKDVLRRTLTGQIGLVSNIIIRPTALIYNDDSGSVVERNFWRSIRNNRSLKNFYCTDGVSCASCDSEEIVCGLLDKTVQVFHRKNFQQVHLLKGHTDHIWSVHLDNNFYISGSWDTTAKIWVRSNGRLFQTCEHPGRKEINGVRIVRGKVYLSSLYGSVCVFGQENVFSLFELLHDVKRPGEIYSMMTTEDLLVASIFSSNCEIDVFRFTHTGDISLECVIEQDTNVSIIWNMFISYPLLFGCRNSPLLDIFQIETGVFIKSLKHLSNVMFAYLHLGIIIVGCQFGNIVLWDLKSVLECDEEMDTGHPACVKLISEHTGGISFIGVDEDEVITADYDATVIVRKIHNHKEFSDIFSSSTK